MSSNDGKLINPIPSQYLDFLAPQYIALYNEHHASKLRADQVDIAQVRSNPRYYGSGVGSVTDIIVGKVEYHDIAVKNPDGSIKVAVYTPTLTVVAKGRMRNKHGLPAHINFHGGGWTLGGLFSDEMWCRHVCQAVGIVIIDVDYRLAPEHPYPTQITDAWAALKWTFANTGILGIDSSRVSIGGMATGAHLATVVALKARDCSNLPALKHQLLTVPAFDVRYVPVEGEIDSDVPYESYHLYGDAPNLPFSRMQWFMKQWMGIDPGLRAKLTNQWQASPILASSHANLPPTSIFCAEVDILKSEAVAYHQKLLDDGTQSSLKVYEGVCHPFGLWLGKLDKANEYISDAEDALRECHHLPPRAHY